MLPTVAPEIARSRFVTRRAETCLHPPPNRGGGAGPRPHIRDRGRVVYSERFVPQRVLRLRCAGACYCQRMLSRERSFQYPRRRHFDARQSARVFVYE